MTLRICSGIISNPYANMPPTFVKPLRKAARRRVSTVGAAALELHLSRIEGRLEQVEKSCNIQMLRMAAMQAEVDRLHAQACQLR